MILIVLIASAERNGSAEGLNQQLNMARPYRRPPVIRRNPLIAQYNTLGAVAAGSATEAVTTATAAKAVTDSILADPDIIGLSGGDAPFSDPQIDALGATASDNLDVYEGGGA